VGPPPKGGALFSRRVVALSEGVSAAETYAENTSAHVVVHSGLDALLSDLEAAGEPSVLSLGRAVTAAQVGAVVSAAHRGRGPIGFIDGWRGAAAAQRHAKALAGWSPRLPAGATVRLGGSALAETVGDYGSIRVVAGDRPTSTMDDDPRRVFAFVTHGNGIDAPFGDQVLCGLLDAGGRRLERYLPCGVGGSCIRRDPAATRRPTLRAPSSLAGDLVIWGTCYGALVGDSIFDARGGVLQGFLDGPGAPRAVLTTYKSWQLDDVAVLAAAILAERGAPLGDLVHLLNAAALTGLAPHDGPPWLLFGDPAASVDEGRGGTRLDQLGDFGTSHVGLARTPDDRRDRVIVAHGSPAPDASSWYAPVPGNPLLVWLRHDADDARLVVEHYREDEHYHQLRRIWDGEDRLEFTNQFCVNAANLTAGDRFVYPSALRDLVDATVSRFRTSRPLLLNEKSVGGLWPDLKALAADESTAWHALNQLLHRALADYIENVGGVIDHSYLPLMGNVEPGTPQPCGYCETVAATEVISVPSGRPTRLVVRCPRCTVVCDTDVSIGTVWIDGPAQTTIGRPNRYQVRVGTQGHRHMSGCLLLQPTPGMAANRGPVVAHHGTSDGTMELQWRAPEGLDPGLYFLVAAVIVDGAVVTARRPIYVS
jgi:hypothetical protein